MPLELGDGAGSNYIWEIVNNLSIIGMTWGSDEKPVFPVL
jgi:hypothetical protein